MASEMVMRSVYLRPEDDSALKQLAFERDVTKNDLIRSAVASKLKEWTEANDKSGFDTDLAMGMRQR